MNPDMKDYHYEVTAGNRARSKLFDMYVRRVLEEISRTNLRAMSVEV